MMSSLLVITVQSAKQTLSRMITNGHKQTTFNNHPPVVEKQRHVGVKTMHACQQNVLQQMSSSLFLQTECASEERALARHYVSEIIKNIFVINIPTIFHHHLRISAVNNI